MKILITGDRGFIASYLKEKLVDLFGQESIYGFDREEYFSGGVLEQYSNIVFDCVFHLAAIARTSECTDDPYNLSYKSNVELTNELLSKINFKKFIYASSCAILGNQKNPSIYPIYEENFPNPLSIYAAQKLFSENLVHLSLKQRKIPSACLRLFNTYGPKQSQLGDYPNVIANMIKCYKQNGYVEVTGDGKQTRNFVYVTDVVDALIKSMEVKGNEIYNVASNSDISINELALLIVNKSYEKIKWIPERPFDIKYQHNININKIKNDLGWNYVVDIEKGISKVLKYEGISN